MDAADGHRKTSTFAILPDTPGDGILVKTIFAGIGRGKNTREYDQRQQQLYSSEICGRVLSVGNKIPSSCSIKPGDVVIVFPWLGCGQCETCSSGCTYLCEEELVAAGEPTAPNHQPQGCFAVSNYLVVQEWQNLIKLPKEIPRDVGCMLPYWALRVYAAIIEAKPAFEQAVVIRGFGNLLVIGSDNLELWCVAFLKNVFCDKNIKVICAESSQADLSLALDAGADDAVLWKDGASVEELVEATTMSGYNKMDVVIDLLGSATSFQVAFLSLHNGGTILELGERGERVDLPLSLLIEKSVGIKAVKAGSRFLLKQLVDLLAIQRVSLNIPTECFDADDFETAAGKVANGEITGHAILRYE